MVLCGSTGDEGVTVERLCSFCCSAKVAFSLRVAVAEKGGDNGTLVWTRKDSCYL